MIHYNNDKNAYCSAVNVHNLYNITLTALKTCALGFFCAEVGAGRVL